MMERVWVAGPLMGFPMSLAVEEVWWSVLAVQ